MADEKQLRYIPVTKLTPNPWNPNYQTDQEFEMLCDSVKETGGLVESLFARPIPDDDPRRAEGYEFEIIAGEHRHRALQALGYDTAPVIVDTMDDELARFLSVRLNQLRGKFDPAKLWAMVQGLKKSYRVEYLSERFGFTKQDELEKLLKKAGANLPRQMRKKLLTRAKEIESLEGLSHVIHNIFNEHGEQLKHSFIAFEFGGVTHVMVRMSDSLASKMFALMDTCEQNVIDASDVVESILEAAEIDKITARVIFEKQEAEQRNPSSEPDEEDEEPKPKRKPKRKTKTKSG